MAPSSPCLTASIPETFPPPGGCLSFWKVQRLSFLHQHTTFQLQLVQLLHLASRFLRGGRSENRQTIVTYRFPPSDHSLVEFHARGAEDIEGREAWEVVSCRQQVFPTSRPPSLLLSHLSSLFFPVFFSFFPPFLPPFPPPLSLAGFQYVALTGFELTMYTMLASIL